MLRIKSRAKKIFILSDVCSSLNSRFCVANPINGQLKF
jgi:hypothetical protein